MSKYKVSLDIGHGTNTYPPSKGVPSMHEFAFNNAVGKVAERHLKASDVEVKIVKGQPFDSSEVGLTARTNLYNKEKVDLVMSIHADWNGNSSARGHWGFYWHTSSEGRKLANIWSKHLSSETGTNHRGNQQSKTGSWTNFHMVRVPHAPAVLMEHAFMSNSQDLKLLKSDTFRTQCGIALAKTACEYLGIAYKGASTPKQTTQSPKNEVATVELFRVRKTWEDVKSQLGAYANLESAKGVAEANKGYSVFDASGNKVGAHSTQPKSSLLKITDPYMSNDKIKSLQENLSEIGLDIGSAGADSYYGKDTEKAVKEFQEYSNIVVDGLVGNETLEEIKEALGRYNSIERGLVLKTGSNGSNVEALQTEMNLRGYNAGAVDGNFGPATHKSVEKFQTDSKILVDGIFGQGSLDALKGKEPKPVAPKPKPTPKPKTNDVPEPTFSQGTHSSEVRKLQIALNNHNPRFDPKGVDGKFGPGTRNALYRYQKYYGLTKDGIYGPQSKASLKKTM